MDPAQSLLQTQTSFHIASKHRDVQKFIVSFSKALKGVTMKSNRLFFIHEDYSLGGYEYSRNICQVKFPLEDAGVIGHVDLQPISTVRSSFEQHPNSSDFINTN